MKIVDERNIKKIPIQEVAPGDCFLDVDNELMMKIADEDANRAISLQDGSIYRLGLNDKVMPVKAKVTIYE